MISVDQIKANPQEARNYLRSLESENKRLFTALRILAVVKHVRLATEGRTVPNGYSCKLCRAECGPEELLKHRTSCILKD